jgi:hypothetical protein
MIIITELSSSCIARSLLDRLFGEYSVRKMLTMEVFVLLVNKGRHTYSGQIKGLTDKLPNLKYERPLPGTD